MEVRAKLTRNRVEEYRAWLQSLPPAKTKAIAEELDALCDMAAEAEELCEQLEKLEGLMTLGNQVKLHEAIGKVRIVIGRFREPKEVLS